MELQAQFNQGAPAAAGGSVSADPTEKPAQRTDKPLELILGKTSVVVTSTGDAQVILDMMDSIHETSMNIAKNMVDPPEVRREKQRRAKEQQKKELDQERRLKETTEKEIDNQRMLDEINENNPQRA